MPLDDSTTVRIPLRARDGSVRAYALVDAADADFVNQWRWCLDAKGYARRSEYLGGGRRGHRVREFKLHRELMGLVRGDGLEVDHRNMNKLDNRRANLRVVSHDEQAQNKPSYTGSMSKYRGVSWATDRDKWRASATLNGQKYDLGSFDSEIEAAEAARVGRARLLPFATD